MTNIANQVQLDLLQISDEFAIDWRHHVYRIKTGTLITGTQSNGTIRWDLTIDNVRKSYNWETLQAMAKLERKII